MMLARLFLLFTLLPIVELVLMVWISRETSVWLVLGLIVASGVAGSWLARRYGAQSFMRVRAKLAQGHFPAEAMWDSVLISLGAVLLILPGVLSDFLAILLLVPATRKVVKRLVAAKVRARFRVSTFDPKSRETGRTEIIDVRVIDPTVEKIAERRP